MDGSRISWGVPDSYSLGVPSLFGVLSGTLPTANEAARNLTRFLGIRALHLFVTDVSANGHGRESK